jgi:hypothetical protein
MLNSEARARMRVTRVPFDSPRARFEASASHLFRDRHRVQVFISGADFRLVVDAYPQLPLERVAAHFAEASRVFASSPPLPMART